MKELKLIHSDAESERANTQVRYRLGDLFTLTLNRNESEAQLIILLQPKGISGWFFRHRKLQWLLRLVTWNFFDPRNERTYINYPRWLWRHPRWLKWLWLKLLSA